MNRLTAAFALLPSIAAAHPGDHGDAPVFHLFTAPDHVTMIGLGAAVATGLILFLVRR